MTKVICKFDGGARPNPGPIAFAVVIHKEGTEDVEAVETRRLGNSLDAECGAFILALNTLQSNPDILIGVDEIDMCGDSSVIFQLVESDDLLHRDKHTYLINPINKIRKGLELLRQRGFKVNLIDCARELIWRADRLVSHALDSKPIPYTHIREYIDYVNRTGLCDDILLDRMSFFPIRREMDKDFYEITEGFSDREIEIILSSNLSSDDKKRAAILAKKGLPLKLAIKKFVRNAKRKKQK